MTKQELVQRMQAGQAWIAGRRVKIDFGADEGVVMLDGAAQQVTEEDGAADTTIKSRLGRLAAARGRPDRRYDRLHDGQAEGRGGHVQRDAAARGAGEAEGLGEASRRFVEQALPGDGQAAMTSQK